MLSEYPQHFVIKNMFLNLKIKPVYGKPKYQIGDSLWNKISAEFGLSSAKQPSSFSLVPSGHTTG